ncbi:MAG: radical SAM protein [bacterium]
MNTHCVGALRITVEREGAREHAKVSYPVRYGRYGEITSSGFVYHFNRKGEIRHLHARLDGWPHPADWLKRTPGNDWVYYSSGEYAEVFGLTGEYYLPCLSYPSNAVVGGNPFANPAVSAALESLESLHLELGHLAADTRRLPAAVRDFVGRIAASGPAALRRRADRLRRLLGGRLTVLPPDTRHVDYDVLPVVVAQGCAYNCTFCRVKSGRPFRAREREAIGRQIEGVRRFFQEDLPNYNSVFLGDHDALRAGAEVLEFAARKAYERFDLAHSYLRGSNLFLFGSADTMARSDEGLFQMLEALPYAATYLNIGLESPDPATLKALGKPVTPEVVEEAFARILNVNRRYMKIEASANFLIGAGLPPTHLPSVMALTSEHPVRSCVKGTAYLSPLIRRPPGPEERRKLLSRFREVKLASRLPVYLYLIQRL